MSAAKDLLSRRNNKRERELLTPEGIALPLRLAARSARLVALVLDYVVILISLITMTYVFHYIGQNLFKVEDVNMQVGEFLFVFMILLFFVIWNGYFIFFEMGPRGATLGKRLLKIRVAARDGGRLTPEMVIARNLLRQIELFLPLSFLDLAGSGSSGAGGFAAAAWFLIFMLFPFFNRDCLRAGDVIAGTWVVEAPRIGLADAMSVEEEGSSRSSEYQFGEAELSVYGEHELKTLEDVLRRGDAKAMATVHEAICRKIGWEAGAGYEREFLEAFYQSLRGKLEGDMRFGKRKLHKDDPV